MLLVALAVGIAVGRHARRFMRFAVAGQSMAPALPEGSWVVVDRGAYAHRPPAPGEVIVVPDPRQPQRLLVKRVRTVDSAGAWVEGDNAEASTDSRTFGPVALASIVGRVRWRYAPCPGAVR